MFNWNAFWNYYAAATNNRNRDKVDTMIKGFDLGWTQYWKKHCNGIGSLFIGDVLYSKGITEFCKMSKTQMMSLGLTTTIADGVIKQLKQYCKNTK